MNNLLEYRTVILSALLHDIGKFLYRGRNLSFNIKGSHPDVSGQFVNAFADVFRPVSDIDLLKTLITLIILILIVLLCFLAEVVMQKVLGRKLVCKKWPKETLIVVGKQPRSRFQV